MQNNAIQAGFTLLEMILVLSILSGLSLLAISFVDNEDNQLRFEDTRKRLEMIRRAINGDTQKIINGQIMLSGYVFDNGVLPASIQSLLQKPSGFDDYSLHAPIFDKKPVTGTGMNDDADEFLGNPEEMLFKGYRGDSYLHALPGTELAFYDGWGNAGVAPDFGWSVTADSSRFKVESLGLDNLLGGAGYDSDMNITVSADDWQVDIAGWQVTVINRSGNDLAIAVSGCLRVSLLVFINDSDSVNPYNWKRLTSDCPTAAINNNDSVVFTFPAAGGFQPPTQIPAGEHLLVLIMDEDDTPHNGSDTVNEKPCLGNTDCNDGSRTSKRVLFVPRALRPQVELVIR